MRIGKLGKGLQPGAGRGGCFGEGSGPPRASCAADGLQTPTGGASNPHLPTDTAAQNPGSRAEYGSTSLEFPSSVIKRNEGKPNVVY